MNISQDMVQWQAFVKVAIIFRNPYTPVVRRVCTVQGRDCAMESATKNAVCSFQKYEISV
jgi:hypothetical protein